VNCDFQKPENQESTVVSPVKGVGITRNQTKNISLSSLFDREIFHKNIPIFVNVFLSLKNSFPLTINSNFMAERKNFKKHLFLREYCVMAKEPRKHFVACFVS